MPGRKKKKAQDAEELQNLMDNNQRKGKGSAKTQALDRKPKQSKDIKISIVPHTSLVHDASEPYPVPNTKM